LDVVEGPPKRRITAGPKNVKGKIVLAEAQAGGRCRIWRFGKFGAVGIVSLCAEIQKKTAWWGEG